MQLVKIGLFVILLSIILFFVVRDHTKVDVERFEGDTQNLSQVQQQTQNLSQKEKPNCGSTLINTDEDDSSTGGGGGCGTCSVPGSNAQLLPVMDPLFNMREICKQSILLEDHLFQKKKRCRDCCIKHQLTIEALAEEAITLDKNRTCEDLYYLPDRIRELQKDFVNGRDPSDIAHEYRKLRKSLMQRCFSTF
jgi:hypothetical protein